MHSVNGRCFNYVYANAIERNDPRSESRLYNYEFLLINVFLLRPFNNNMTFKIVIERPYFLRDF
jgi:hypothetical protein